MRIGDEREHRVSGLGAGAMPSHDDCLWEMWEGWFWSTASVLRRLWVPVSLHLTPLCDTFGPGRAHKRNKCWAGSEHTGRRVDVVKEVVTIAGSHPDHPCLLENQGENASTS